jgi:hypothetical protein
MTIEAQPRRQDAEDVAFAASGVGSGCRGGCRRGDPAGHLPWDVLTARSCLPFSLLGEPPF